MVMRKFCDRCGDPIDATNSVLTNLQQRHKMRPALAAAALGAEPQEIVIAISVTAPGGSMPLDYCANCVIDQINTLDKRPKPAPAG